MLTLSTRRGWKWVVVALWVVLMAVLGIGLGSRLTDVEKNDTKSWLPASAESTRALDVAESVFQPGDDVGLVIAYARASGPLTEADQSKIQLDQQSIRPILAGGISQVLFSPDGRAAMMTARLFSQESELSAFNRTVTKIKDVAHHGTPAGLTVKVTGDAGATGDFAEAFGGFDSTLLLAALGIVAFLLILTYRSPVIWVVPLLCAFVASQIAAGVVYLLAKGDVITVNGQSAAILPILTIGVGTDYALLLIARYREELHQVEDRHAAMAVAVRRTAPAVVASALTVALAMLALLVSELNSNKGLGPVLAIGVVVVFLAMMTFLPAMLVCLGRWVFWPNVPRHDEQIDTESRHALWSRIAGFVVRRHRPIWVVTVVVLAAFAAGTTAFDHGRLPNGGFTKHVESVDGLTLLAKHFPAGASQPVDVYASRASADRVQAAVDAVPDVAQLLPPVVTGDWVKVSAVLSVPSDSPAAYATVDRIREAVRAVPGANPLVGGLSAVNRDVNQAATRDQNLVIPLALLLVLLVLFVLLRSVAGPVLLLATVALSFYASMGAAGLILRAMGYANISSGFFLGCFIFLVALGVDYTIFLMTRAREEVLALGDHVEGVRKAVAVTGGVITSAGLVLAGTFAVLGVMPIIFLLQVGIIVALGVLLDTFVVRTLLVPAVAIEVGRRFWWPSALARGGGGVAREGAGVSVVVGIPSQPDRGADDVDPAEGPPRSGAARSDR